MEVIWIETSSDMLFPPPEGGKQTQGAKGRTEQPYPPPSVAVVALSCRLFKLCADLCGGGIWLRARVWGSGGGVSSPSP
jgi:hypothetical protein